MILCNVIWLSCLAFSVVQAQLRDSHPDLRREPADGRIEYQSDVRGESKKLKCIPTGSGQDALNIRWFKIDPNDGKTELSEVTNQVGGMTVGKGELELNSETLKNREIFRCKLDDQKFADFEIIDTKLAGYGKLFFVERFSRSFNVIENEDLKINCHVINRTSEGFDQSEVAIKWFTWNTVDDLTFETDASNCSISSMAGSQWTEIEVHEDATQEPHYSFLSKDGFSKAVLKIEDAVRSDRRGYKCVAYNVTSSSEDNDCSETTTFVRVKDKLAALWPFLGIVAEVVVLSLFILIVEKRRASKELEDEEEEEEDGVVGSNTDKNKETVRQRK